MGLGVFDFEPHTAFSRLRASRRRSSLVCATPSPLRSPADPVPWSARELPDSVQIKHRLSPDARPPSELHRWQPRGCRELQQRVEANNAEARAALLQTVGGPGSTMARLDRTLRPRELSPLDPRQTWPSKPRGPGEQTTARAPRRLLRVPPTPRQQGLGHRCYRRASLLRDRVQAQKRLPLRIPDGHTRTAHHLAGSRGGQSRQRPRMGRIAHSHQERNLRLLPCPRRRATSIDTLAQHRPWPLREQHTLHRCQAPPNAELRS